MGTVDTSGLHGWASPDAVETAAADLKSAGTSIQNTTTDAKNTWAGMGAVYEAPERDIVLTAFDDVAGAGEEVQDAAATVGQALTTFAAEVRAMVPARNALIDDAAAASAQEEDDAEAGSGIADLQSRITAQAQAYQDAEERCATAIVALHSRFTAGPGLLGGPLVGVSSAISQGTIARLNYSPIQQPTFDAPIRTTGPLRMDQTPFDLVHRGDKYTYNRSGLLIPSHVAATAANPTPVAGRWSNLTLKADPTVAKPPAWARMGGRGLGIAGAGLTLWDATSSRYQQDLVEHPEWGTGERVASAGIDAVVVGGMSLAGAAAGAKVGAVVGGMVGGPVGLVVGVAVGAGLGYLGGALGKEFGEEIREGLGDTADAMAEGIADAGSAIADGAEEVWDSLWG